MITYTHDLFGIFTLYDQEASRAIRLTLYYLKLIYCLTINAIFNSDYTTTQKIALNIIFSSGIALISVALM